MKNTDWKDIAELVGIAAIVASLIFVGQQLRLDRQVAMSEGWLQFEETQIGLSSLISGNSELWIKGLDGAELDSVEQLKFDQIAAAVEARFFSRFERSVGGLRSARAQLELLKLANDMYVHVGLRRSLINRWQRYRNLPDWHVQFHTEVLRTLDRFDSGELEPSSDKVYAY